MDRQEGYEETFGHKVTTQDVKVDSVTREDIDMVADDYQVSVVYDEGEFSVYGESGEVEDFLNDVESIEKKQGETAHPVKSIMQEADISVVSHLEPSDDREIMPDGGQEIGYARVFDYNGGPVPSGHEVSANFFTVDGQQKVAVHAEGKQAVERYLEKERQNMGPEDVECHFDQNKGHEQPSFPITSEEAVNKPVATDGGSQVMADVNHTTDAEIQESFEKGITGPVPGTSFSDYDQETDYTGRDPEGRMGM